MRHGRRWMGVLALGLLLGAAACVPTGPPAGTPLPDLAMARIQNISVLNSGGTADLQFTTTVVNIGDADFRLQATRPNTSTAWKVNEVLPDGHGGLNSYPTNAGYVYGGDGHNHWHVKGLASYNLYALPNLTFSRKSTKSGFCFFDVTPYRLTLPGAPQSAIYNSLDCGAQSALESSMGLSIGWGDTYPKGLIGQDIDITGLAAGDYRLQVTADLDHVFFEKTTSNNSTYTDFTLNYDTSGLAHIKVIATGPQP